MMSFRAIQENCFTWVLCAGLMMLLMVATCHASGEVSITLNDVAATIDWSGGEKTSSAWGLIGEYGKSSHVGSSTEVSANIRADYSQRKIESKKAAGKDEIRCKLDIAKDKKNIGGKGFVSVKTYTHFGSDDYTVYLNTGVGMAGSVPFVASGTARLVILDYGVKASVSQNWQEIRDKTNAHLGMLFEVNVTVASGHWAFSLDDGDVFFSGDRSFELPFAIEYNMNPLFIRQVWLIRGDSENAGCLRTVEAGIRLKIK